MKNDSGQTRVTEADCRALDALPGPLDAARAGFAPGADGTIYLDANSIGPMPQDAPRRMAALLEDGWRRERRRGWNDGEWLGQPRSLGGAIAHLVGAARDDVLVCDTTSVNLYKLLRLALEVAAPRRTIVVESAVFPTNRYVAEGIAKAGQATLLAIDSVDDLPAILAGNDVAVVALSHVDYRYSVRLDMASLTALAHRHGAMVLWDLSHSAGAVAIDLRGCDADFAVASGYKYLCGGPGAPALLYVHPRWQTSAWPAICGWMGHADMFDFSPGYLPAPGVQRLLAGTPAVIANAAWSAAADLWQTVNPRDLDDRHRSLSEMLITLLEQECAGMGVELTSPRAHELQGGHVAVRLEGSGNGAGADIDALGQALVAANVIVSTRKPDSLRFGIHPISTRYLDLWEAVARLRAILQTDRWRETRSWLPPAS